MKRIMCPKCGCLVEYNDKTVWEGNREFEDVNCPNCGEHLDRVFIDGSPNERIVNENNT
nr:hypothetical protein [uncultured Butyrivibrio sp.]